MFDSCVHLLELVVGVEALGDEVFLEVLNDLGGARSFAELFSNQPRFFCIVWQLSFPSNCHVLILFVLQPLHLDGCQLQVGGAWDRLC